MRLLKQAAMFAALFFAVPCLAIGLAPVAAFAQEVASGAIVVAEPTLVQTLVTAALPILGLVITFAIAWGAFELHKRTGITIEAKHREALQSALMNGVLFALQRAGWVQGQPTDPLLASARSYVESSVPDALKKFGINPATPKGKAALDRLLTPKLPVPAGTIMPNGDVLIGRAPK